MPCLCPRDVWPAPPGAENRRPVSSPRRSYAGAKAFSIPCGQCAGCRLAKRAEFALRCVHEASLHEAACFVTWTYDDEHLPADLSLSVRVMQKTMKRLRNHVGGLRFATRGEYGDKNGRPHYHSLLFGEDFRADRYPWSRSETGGLQYRSPTLEKVWPFGHVLVSDFTFQTAGYVAGYVQKKLNGPPLEASLLRRSIDAATGEIREWKVAREFLLASTKPGLGAGWFERFKSDAFPSDFLIFEGKRVPVPRYYLKKLSEAERLEVVAARKRKAALHAENNGDSRLLVRNELAELRAARFKRSLDEVQ